MGFQLSFQHYSLINRIFVNIKLEEQFKMNKKSNPFLFILLVIIAIILYLLMNKKEAKTVAKRKMEKNIVTKTVKEVNTDFIVVENHFQDVILEGEGIYCKKKTIPILSTKNGVIDSISILKNKVIKRNKLAFIYENNQLFKKMSTRKVELKKQLIEIFEELNIDFKKEVVWNQFIDSLSPELILPILPQISDQNLLELMQEKGTTGLYNQLIDDEEKMNKFFLINKENGKVLSINVETGDQVYKGDTLAILEEYIPELIKIELKESQIEKIKTADKILFYDQTKTLVGKGKFFFLKKGNEQNTCYLSFNLIENNRVHPGQEIFYKSSKIATEKCFSLPKTYLYEDSNVIVGSKVKLQKRVNIISSTDSYAFVSGLNDGDTLVSPQK